MIKSIVTPSFIDWHGKISTVLFLGGCNFKCPYCHNKPIAQTPEGFQDCTLDDLCWDWIDGVVVSGGEPTIHLNLPEFLYSLRCRYGLPIKLDTNGSNPRMLKSLIDMGFVDFIAMDVKAPLTEKEYGLCCGVFPPPLDEIKASIQLIKSSGVEYEFRITPYPKENPDDIACIMAYTGTLKVQRLR